MTDRAELREAILEGQSRFDMLTRNCDSQAIETEPVCGEWTVKVVAWHLADWIEEMLAAGRAAVEGVLVEGHPIADIDAFNREHVLMGEHASWVKTSSRLHRTVELAAGFVIELDDAHLELPAVYPWGGEGTLAQVMAGIPWHHGVHSEDVERWRNERTGG
ncbi:hypothetical protein BH23CHL4_BH23CHL4_26610 [soil metagenome]